MKTFKAIWDAIGAPGFIVVLMIGALITRIGAGPDPALDFWMGILVVCFYLSSILEEIKNKKDLGL
jgi:hypothetical protein